MSEPIYLDNHATTPLDHRVAGVMWPWLSERVGNAASRHIFGRRAREAVETARQQVARAIGAHTEEIIFTSGATEANNLAIKGLAGGHIITSAAEHRAVLDPVRRLRRQQVKVTILPVDEHAHVDPQSIVEALTTETSLVSVMLANNEVGTLNPIQRIAGSCRERNVWLHTDAAQAVGRLPVDVRDLDVDLLSLTAHKLYGPQGIGALYVRRSDPPLPLSPLLDGGGHERRLRSGTLPVALIVGFGAACELAVQEMPAEAQRLATQRDRLQQRLVSALEDVSLNGHPTQRLAGNLNMSFGGVDGDALLTRLDGLAVSSGSACTSADPQPSHVLRAMGIDESRARASLRFGLGRFTTNEESDLAAEIVIGAVTALRAATS
jgi:cysteine desulfurase